MPWAARPVPTSACVNVAWVGSLLLIVIAARSRLILAGVNVTPNCTLAPGASTSGVAAETPASAPVTAKSGEFDSACVMLSGCVPSLVRVPKFATAPVLPTLVPPTLLLGTLTARWP